MSDLFEKRKRMEYLLNTLDNKTFVREHFNGVCNWLNEKGNLYLPAFKIPETGNNGDDSPFKKRRYAKKDMAAVIVDYTAALRDKVRSARRRVPSLFERNLIFVQRLLGLSDPEKEFLGFLVRLECDDEISGIMSEMDSPRYHVNLSEAAMMAGVSRDRAAQMCRRDSALAQLGLIDIDSRGTPKASDIAQTFYSTPFKSEDEVRRFTFKVRYDCLTDEQRSLCFEHFFKIKGADLNHLPSLTPGDFAVVKEKAMFFDCLNDKRRLIEMLEIEQKNKSPVKHKIGF